MNGEKWEGELISNESKTEARSDGLGWSVHERRSLSGGRTPRGQGIVSPMKGV